MCVFSCSNPFVDDIFARDARLLSGSVVIDGNNWVAETLSANTSRLGGSGAISYQWKRGAADIGTGSSDYTIESADVGEKITVTVSRADNTGTITSNAVTAIAQQITGGTVPLVGTVKIGSTLTIDGSGISGGSGSISYQWQADGVDISGATGTSYTIQGQDAGRIICCEITLSGTAGSLYTQSAKIPYTISIFHVNTPVAPGDSVTAAPDTGHAGDIITLNYTVAGTKHDNQLDFEGIIASIPPVTSASSGTRTYTVNAADASGGVIIIDVVFEHTDLVLDPITFTNTTPHIYETYGNPVTNAVAAGYNGTGAITYSSSDTSVATVNTSGVVSILKVGTTVITAQKAADAVYAHASHAYTLTVTPRPLTITPNAGQSKVFGGADPTFTYTASEALLAGNAFSGAVGRISGEVAGTYPYTLGNLSAGGNYTLSLGGSAAFEITKTLTAQAATVAAAPSAISVLASGSATGSITAGVVALTNNAGSQAAEYAIDTASGTNPASLTWQAGTTFTGLNAGTAYYVYARAAENGNYNAGAASVSAAITFFNVVFDGNSHTGGTVPATIAAFAGTVITVPQKGNLVRTGYNFLNWNTAANASGASHLPGDLYTVNANAVLYARWGGGQSLSFTVANIAANDPVISASNIVLSHAAGDSITLTLADTYTSIEWWSGATLLGSGPSLTLNVNNPVYNQIGLHHLSVEVWQSGSFYNTSIEFRVTN